MMRSMMSTVRELIVLQVQVLATNQCMTRIVTTVMLLECVRVTAASELLCGGDNGLDLTLVLRLHARIIRGHHIRVCLCAVHLG